MILKFTKCLNDKKEFTLLSFDMFDSIDDITEDSFYDVDGNKIKNIFETDENYYYYIEDIIDLGDSEKFKIKTKKGDIVSLTARDNSYIIYPSKKSFCYAFDFKYTDVLQYKYEEVLIEGKPYEVKYVKDNEAKINDGVVYTLNQLVSYISTLIKGYIYKDVKDTITFSKGDIKINRVIQKYYSSEHQETNKKYELNIKKIAKIQDKWYSKNIINISKSNKYLYDYYLITMFAYMILAKSKNDIKNNVDNLYRLNREFENIEDVLDFLENNQDIVNNFFIETEMLFNKPNDMITSYSPFINGIYMFSDCNNIKTYLYRAVDERYFKEKSLKQTYISTRYKHKIKGIKANYTNE